MKPRSKPPKVAPDPFRWFDSSPEVIRLVVMMYVRYPLSLRKVPNPFNPERHLISRKQYRERHYRRPGLAAGNHGIRPVRVRVSRAGWRRVAFRLTAPPGTEIVHLM
jgi:hypothetical protein